MKKLSLESFKSKFNDATKTELIDELTGGVLGHCHCEPHPYSHCGGKTWEDITSGD